MLDCASEGAFAISLPQGRHSAGLLFAPRPVALSAAHAPGVRLVIWRLAGEALKFRSRYCSCEIMAELIMLSDSYRDLAEILERTVSLMDHYARRMSEVPSSLEPAKLAVQQTIEDLLAHAASQQAAD